MLDYDITKRSHFTGKDGEASYDQWTKMMGLNTEDFPFRVKNLRYNKRGHQIHLNVVSWGFYQGSDWSYYVFVTYRTSDNKYTCSYHWGVDENAKPVGQPRKHEWNN